MSQAPLGIIHLYAQHSWHEEAYIVGNHLALSRLCDAIQEALRSGKARFETWAADGEGYEIHIIQHGAKGYPGDEGWQDWDKVAVPYTADYAQESREDIVQPEKLAEVKS